MELTLGYLVAFTNQVRFLILEKCNNRHFQKKAIAFSLVMRSIFFLLNHVNEAKRASVLDTKETKEEKGEPILRKCVGIACRRHIALCPSLHKP
jgi:hypothetical protein